MRSFSRFLNTSSKIQKILPYFIECYSSRWLFYLSGDNLRGEASQAWGALVNVQDWNLGSGCTCTLKASSECGLQKSFLTRVSPLSRVIISPIFCHISSVSLESHSTFFNIFHEKLCFLVCWFDYNSNNKLLNINAVIYIICSCFCLF